MRFIFIIFLFLFGQTGQCEILLGTGFSSTTEGRSVPMLNLGLDDANKAYLLSTVGVATEVYYHNAYLLSAYRQTDLDDFWWGQVRVGLGGGLQYSKRSYKDGGPEETADDFSIGPSVRATWEVFPHGYVGIESYFGFGNLNILVLSTQQITHLVFGVRI